MTENVDNLVAFAKEENIDEVLYILERNFESMSTGIIFVHNVKVIGNLSSRINQDVKFIDTNTGRVYECYKINNRNVMNQLGIFNSSFQYISLNAESLLTRRGKFQGYKMKAITEMEMPFISIDVDIGEFDQKSQTYDVTYSTKGVFFDIFIVMQEQLNFTATIHKRKDGAWGPILVFQNGTILTRGLFNSLTSGFAEIAVTRLVYATY